MQCALAEIESLRQQLNKITEELHAHQIGHDHIIAEKDAEIEHLDRTKAEWKNTAKLLDEQLAASQAREQQLREAVRQNQEWHENYDEYGGYPESELAEVNEKALAIPADTTALEAMLAKAGEVMRERCSDSAQTEMDEQYIDSSPWYAARACREAIRDIPCVTLEDLQK